MKEDMTPRFEMRSVRSVLLRSALGVVGPTTYPYDVSHTRNILWYERFNPVRRESSFLMQQKSNYWSEKFSV